MTCELHCCQAEPSIEHSKYVGVGLPLNANVAEVERIVPVGPDVIVVSGPSTKKVRCAGEASVFPARSVARTRKVCEPAARPL